MKQHIPAIKLILILLTIGELSVFAQNTAKFFDLNHVPRKCSDPEMCEDDYYFARDYITLKEGCSIVPYTAYGYTFKLDKSLIFEIENSECIAPPQNATRIINKQLSYGSLPGDVSVDASGNANYVIPIALPVGKAGLEPSISIYYNSSMGPGLLGEGFSISGISAISKTGKDKFHDGEPSAIGLNAGDVFSLDGQRLMLKTGIAYGADKATYQTEFKSFDSIISHGQLAACPEWFEVVTQDNKKLTFGNTISARLSMYDDIYNNEMVLGWYLTKVTDALGNYMEYTYNKTSAGEVYLSSIKYTGNSTSNLAPYNEVRFYYQENSRNNFAYIGGESFTKNLLIREIETYSNNQLVRRYAFKYSNYANLFKKNLSEITEYNADNDSINSTTFERFGQPQMYSTTTTGNTSTGNLFWGDFNGDGFNDYVEANEASFSLYVNNKLGSFSRLQGPVSYNAFTFNYALTGDFNGDGISDMAFITRNKPNPGVEFYDCRVTFYSGSASGLVLKDTQIYPDRTFKENTLYEGDWEKLVHAGDVDGDGIDDVFINDVSSGLLLGTPVGNPVIKVDVTFANDPSPREYYAFLLDYDGDGKTEYVKTSGYGVYKIYEYSNAVFTLTSNLALTEGYDNLYWGDFNGDGKIDIIGGKKINNLSTLWSILYSTGKGLMQQEITLDANPILDRLLIGDLDGDGLSDIVVLKNDWPEENEPPEVQTLNLNVYLNNGANEFVFQLTQSQPNIRQGTSHLIDVSNDGQADLLLINQVAGAQHRYSFYPNNKTHLVKSVKNGIGMRTEIEYDDIANSPANGFYSKTVTPTFPLVAINAGINVVKNVKTYSSVIGSQLISDVSYKYSNAQYHAGGLGYMGFQTNTLTNNLSNTEVYTSYTLVGNRHVKFGTYNRVKRNSTLLSENTYTPQVTTSVTPNGNIYFGYISQGVSHDALNNNTVTSDYNYNLTTFCLNYSKVSYSDGSYTQTNYSHYKGKGSFLPQKITHTSKNASDPVVFSSTDSVSYHNTYFYPLVSYTNKGKQTEVKVEYLNYDAFGNPRSIRTTPVNLNPVTKTMVFDNTGRFISSETNPIGTAYASYNHLGQVLTTTDIYGNVDSVFYDNWNRAVKSVSNTGVASVISTNWATTSDPTGTLYTTLGQTENAPYAKTYYDARGNAIRSETMGFGNRTYLQDNVFDTQNRLQKTSLVYQSGSGQLWNNYQYNTTDGRLLKVTAATTAVTDHSYGNLWQQQQINGNTFRQEYAVTGQLSRSVNPAGSAVVYSYYSHGGIKNVTSPGGLISYTYDANGRLQSIADPLLGTTNYQYAYNATGAKNTVTDARGNSFETQYDNLNRPITVKNTASSEQTTIAYVSSGNGKGLVASASYTDGSLQSSVSFVYDKYGRVTQKTHVIGTETYTENYTYNKFNQVVLQSNSLGKTKEYIYNSIGLLTEIKYQGTRVWQLTESTLTTSSEWLGNGLTLTTTVDEFGNPVSQKAGNVLDWSYNVNDLTGNLTSRTQKRYNSEGTYNTLSESFTYDNLDRLLTITSSGDDVSVAYDSDVKERIGFKTDAGADYAYNTAKPYSLEMVNSPTAALTSQCNENITYNSFNKVATISKDNKLLEISYGIGGNRAKAVYKLGGVIQYTKYYFGSFEKTVFANGNTTKDLYVGLGNATLLEKDINGTSTKYYLLHDHLASVVAVTSSSGTLAEEYSYDAWGRRRNPANWTYTGVTTPSLTNRGYTGHEHIEEFGLINMNGRVYDPLLALFLSPDPVIQSPLDPQNYNRYSYVLNNPLKYTDPSGYQYRRNMMEFEAAANAIFHTDGSGGFGGAAAGFSDRLPPSNYYSYPSLNPGCMGYRYDRYLGIYVDNATGNEVSEKTAISYWENKYHSYGESYTGEAAKAKFIINNPNSEVFATDSYGNKEVFDGKTMWKIPFFVFTGNYYNAAYFASGVAAYGTSSNSSGASGGGVDISDPFTIASESSSNLVIPTLFWTVHQKTAVGKTTGNGPIKVINGKVTEEVKVSKGPFSITTKDNGFILTFSGESTSIGFGVTDGMFTSSSKVTSLDGFYYATTAQFQLNINHTLTLMAVVSGYSLFQVAGPASNIIRIPLYY